MYSLIYRCVPCVRCYCCVVCRFHIISFVIACLYSELILSRHWCRVSRFNFHLNFFFVPRSILVSICFLCGVLDGFHLAITPPQWLSARYICCGVLSPKWYKILNLVMSMLQICYEYEILFSFCLARCVRLFFSCCSLCSFRIMFC